MPIFAAIPGALAAIGGGSALAGGLAVGSAAAGLYGANRQASATRSAAAGVNNAATQGNILNTRVYDDTSRNLAPTILQGTNATNTLNNVFASGNPFASSTGQTYQESPGFNIALERGLGSVAQNKAFQGALRSGSAIKSASDYATGSILQDYDRWWGRDQTQLGNNNNVLSQYINYLTGQQDQGVRAASAQGGVAQGYADRSNANTMNAATTAGNAQLVGAQNTNNLLSSITGTFGNILGQGGFGRPAGGSSYGSPPPAPPMTGWAPPRSTGRPMQSIY
jgi:hypothetical protein